MVVVAVSAAKGIEGDSGVEEEEDEWFEGKRALELALSMRIYSFCVNFFFLSRRWDERPRMGVLSSNFVIAE